MKRAFAITMMVAMIGSLLFIGFAGTAAASTYKADDQTIKQGASVDQKQSQYVAQTNNNVQKGNNKASAGWGGNAQAGHSSVQANLNVQDQYGVAANAASQKGHGDQTIRQGASVKQNQHQAVTQANNNYQKGNNYASAGWGGSASAGHYSAQLNANQQSQTGFASNFASQR